MKYKEQLGKIIKYLPLIAILTGTGISLYRGSTTIIDTVERSIRIWTDSLTFSAIIGIIGNLLVIDRFCKLLTGKTINIVDDIIEEDSQNVAVTYNGMVGSTFVISVITGFYLLHVYTNKELFLTIVRILSVVYPISTVVYIIVTYQKTKRKHLHSFFLKLSNPVFIPMIICMIQLLITRKNVVGILYNTIYKPQSDVHLIIALIIILFYFLLVVFCHYSNLYCLISYIFLNRGSDKIRMRIELLEENAEKREEVLRQITKFVDEKSTQVGVIKKFWLAIKLIFTHIKIYLADRLYAAIYLVVLFDLRITKYLGGLLNPEQIRTNGTRFCLLVAVFELLILDFVLFIYLESNDPCLKFFELLSTVAIIPILLSWLTELKNKKN